MTHSSPLQTLLGAYRKASKTEREKGNYFEELTRTYLRHEPTYADLYSDVWLLTEVPDEFGISRKDTGIDLVARTHGTGEFHAIQCKFYDHQIKKSDIDSFFTASGQKPFAHRVIVTTTNDWSENAEAALINQQPAVTRIDLLDLETSQIDWAQYHPTETPTLKPKFAPRPHQQSAITSVDIGLKQADRGKLIMACGTGKTFTSLKIAEQQAGKGRRVLFLVPSLALVSQTLTEWTQQSETPLHSFAVCSDAEIGKKRKSDDDVVQTFVHELRYPATTNAARLAEEVSKRHDDQHMSVVFSTYHSIQVLSTAQQEHGLPEFDLIICDEAHRTTGATFGNEEESAFVKVHDNDFVTAKKRLYMTATPRIYADIAKAKALAEGAELCSMDDEELYGKQLHVITFSEAVELGLLTDYKVVVLTIDEDHVSERLQKLLADDDNQLKVDDAARIIGCWKALAKQGLAEDLKGDAAAMQKAVAFCQVIEPSTGRKHHKVSSKQISEMFQLVVDEYQETADEDVALRCESQHVDGSMNATEKGEKIAWLKESTDDETCRILCNVRCLSEGVDVPALDAVLFLSPRSSQVEVVQSVGRVMRNAPGKKLGYVVLPVVIPHGMEPADALNDNKVYKVVWEVLQALRSHDDRFDAFVNKVDLVSDTSGRMEVIAVTDTLSPKSKGTKKKDGKGDFDLGDTVPVTPQVQRQLQFEVDGLERALYAKLVKKCGNRLYWEEWANDIAQIAQTHISRIQAIIDNEENEKEIAAFKAFADELRDDLNDSITDEEVIEMLAQHLITKPVFDALFADYSFASNNPVSRGMQNILDLLQEHRLDKEADTLEQFYASVRRRADGIDKAEGKQKIVVELYDKFFRNAFPRMTERLGIVYTPVEVVDFIIHSVNDILQEEFGQTLGSKGVHILDPFVGTGTFITRLMQSGLITPEQLPHKYKHEIHCNEIVLLAYYIAAINIEAVYHGIMGDWVRGLENKEKSDGVTVGQGSYNVAGGDESGRDGLSGDKEFSEGRTVRTDQSSSSGSGVDPGEHRGGLRSAESKGVSALPVDREGITDGTGNPSLDRSASGLRDGADNATTPTSTYVSRQTSNRSAQEPPLTQHPKPQTPFPYTPFTGICLTDTFAMYESDDLIEQFFPDNSERRKRQKKLDIRVIVGNPPYSVGQESANDENQNIEYPQLDDRIRATYVEKSTAANVRNSYDTYRRAIRWASDRIKDNGVVGFVTSAGFVDDKTSDGIRRCLADEYSNLYVFHLRGDQYTKGEVSRREGGKIFGSGSRSPIAISFLVKNASSPANGEIRFHDIGDYLSREEKLSRIVDFGSVNGITAASAWARITPDKYGDWVNQRDERFDEFVVVGDKDNSESAIFWKYSQGVTTNRDAWCFNSSRTVVLANMERTIQFYNSEVSRFSEAHEELTSQDRKAAVGGFINTDDSHIKWTRALKKRLEAGGSLSFDALCVTRSVYRPFNKRWLYFKRELNEYIYQMHKLFPEPSSVNRAIMVKQRWSGIGQIALMVDSVCENQIDGGAQCFPLHIYEESETGDKQTDLFGQGEESQTSGYFRRNAINDTALQPFLGKYSAATDSITKEDLFYYIYGLLHSPEYRERYKDNLSKELPRIPAVKKFEDFQAFSQAGRDLAQWHLDYETVDCHPVTLDFTAGDKGPQSLKACKDEHFYVRKMKFPKVKDPETGKRVNDKTTVIYNDYITVRDIPLSAYDYVVNGKSAIEWVMERQAVTTDKKSGITNDANLWATETMNNAAYPLELLMRVITVSLETNRIVGSLPTLGID